MNRYILLAAFIVAVACVDTRCSTFKVDSDLACNCKASKPQICPTDKPCHVYWTPNKFIVGGTCRVCTDLTTSSEVVHAGPAVEQLVGRHGTPPRFATEQCVCHGDKQNGRCRHFSGSSSDCSRWARTMAVSYIYGSWTTHYMPPSKNRLGSCEVCGVVDPCNPMH